MGWGWPGGTLPATGGEGEDLIIGGIHIYIYTYIHHIYNDIYIFKLYMSYIKHILYVPNTT